MAISINDVTSVAGGGSSISGSGIFDVLLKAQLEHLKNEFMEQRITGEQYAKAYISIVNNTMNQAIQFELQQDLTQAQIDGIVKDNLVKDEQILLAKEQIKIAQKDQALKDKQIALLQEQIETQDKQQLLYAAQTDGYKRDSELKISKLYIDMMATRVSVDEATYDLALAGLTNEATKEVLTKLRQNAGM